MSAPLLGHYFHLVAEMLAGAWRVLAAAPELIAKGSAIGMSFPRRMIFARADDWRDHACVAPPPCFLHPNLIRLIHSRPHSGLNAWLLATVFPSAAIEETSQWEG
jgi:hypothetical protein